MATPLSSPQAQRSTVIGLLHRAAALHQRGELDEAEKLYRDVLAREGGNFDALHLLGVLMHQRGQSAEALALIAQALKINARTPAAYSNYGIVLDVLARHEEALASYERAIALKPDYTDAYNNRGNALRALKRYGDALASYAKALALRPDHPEAHNNMGNALIALGRNEEALASYDRAIACRPGYADAFVNRGKCLVALKRKEEALDSFKIALTHQPRHAAALRQYGDLLADLDRLPEALVNYDKALAIAPAEAETHAARGYVLRQLKRYDEAGAAYDRALALKPDFVDAIVARGNLLFERQDFAGALIDYERALALRPDFAFGFNSRGNALHALSRHDEALASFARALELDPGCTEAYNNRGNALLNLNRPAEALADYDSAVAQKPFAFALINRGCALRHLDRPDDALASFDRALALNPDLPEAHWNKALLNLSLGNYEQGWQDFEWRWRGATELTPRGFKEPQWQGEDIAGKTILLHAEQGFGDSIQMLRYLPMVAAKGARVVLEIEDSLRPLVDATSVGVIGRGKPLPRFDLHCPLMSLPLAFGTRVETIPLNVPYLRAPAERHDKWRARLPRGEARRRVGLVWSGKATHKNDHNRSLPLALLEPLFDVAGVDFVSLQRECREADLALLTALPIDRLDSDLGDFGDTAAAIERLDLVISVDSAVAHLAGALGKPLWILVSEIQDWRWLRDREDSPWYPTARLFRQPQIGEWSVVVARLRDALTAFAATS